MLQSLLASRFGPALAPAIAYLLLSTAFVTSFARDLSCERGFRLLGSSFSAQRQAIHFGLYAPRAERVQVFLYHQAMFGSPAGSFLLTKNNETGVWEAEASVADLQRLGFVGTGAHVTQLNRPVYYGYRLWGPNWEYSPEWRPGSLAGFKFDVDHDGNRFNPNKLLFDPRALELSHDPLNVHTKDPSIYLTGPEHRHRDSGPHAPKGIVLNPIQPLSPNTPPIVRPLKDDIIYEVHVKGFTQNDPSVPYHEAGTYRGAGRKAKYLKALGVTAVEFLPVQEFQNEHNNPHHTEGNNYWGYMTHGFFAPNRQFATAESRNTLGGVTREFQEMVEAFHAEGIKVIIDVVYNHTGEGGAGGPNGEYAKLLSMRGIDNTGYYQVAADRRFYKDNSGCGGNLNCVNPATADLVLDSVKYFSELGVDGFRFDLASVLGNVHYEGNDFHFDPFRPTNPLNRALAELPGRPYHGGLGKDLIAEPWAVNDHSYRLGEFPRHPGNGSGWAEWNGKYRDIVRRSQNAQGHEPVSPGELAERIAGSSDLFGGDDGRHPGHSINFVVAHDGFTLNDLYRWNDKDNWQAAPYGPSDGGEPNNHSWNQRSGNEPREVVEARQRQATRNGFLLPLLSFGTPMFTGGDEFGRSQRGNNNMWNVDSVGSWLDWRDKQKNAPLHTFAKQAIQFRTAHSAFRRDRHFTGLPEETGLPDISWYTPEGRLTDGHYMDNRSNSFLAYRVGKGTTESPQIYIGYNYGPDGKTITLPPPSPGKRWHWVADTSSYYEKTGNFDPVGRPPAADQLNPDSSMRYLLDGRAIAVFVER